MHTIQCKAILFDFDGTLIDTTAAVERMWSTWGHENGIDPNEILKSSHGRRTLDVIQLHVPAKATMEEVFKLESQLQTHPEGTIALPSAKKILESIPNGFWGIGTSGTRFHAEGLLKYVELPHPEELNGVLVTSDQVSHGKPAPETYLLAAQRLGVDITECVVFEDAPAGILAGVSSGAKTIAVCTSHAKDDIKGLGQILTIKDLTYISVQPKDTGMLDIVITESVGEMDC